MGDAARVHSGHLDIGGISFVLVVVLGCTFAIPWLFFGGTKAIWAKFRGIVKTLWESWKDSKAAKMWQWWVTTFVVVAQVITTVKGFSNSLTGGMVVVLTTFSVLAHCFCSLWTWKWFRASDDPWNREVSQQEWTQTSGGGFIPLLTIVYGIWAVVIDGINISMEKEPWNITSLVVDIVGLLWSLFAFWINDWHHLRNNW